MASKLKTSFAVGARFEPFYLGGKLEVSQDNEFIFSSSGNVVKVFSIKDGAVRYKLQADEEDQITMFVLNPVTETLVTVSRSFLVREWSWRESKVLRTWKAVHRAAVTCMSFDSTGQLLATGSADSTIKIWHTELKWHTHSLRGSKGVINVVKFHPDQSRGMLASAADDCLVRIWNLGMGKMAAAMEGHFGTISDLQFSLDGNNIISSSRDKILIVWNLASFAPYKKLAVFEEVEKLAMLPADFTAPGHDCTEGNMLVLTGGSKGRISVWDVTAGRKLDPIAYLTEADGTEDEQRRIVQLHLSAKLNKLLVASADQNVVVYDFPSLKTEHQFSGFNDEIFDLKFAGANEGFAVVATNSARLKVYNITTADCRFADGHRDAILCIAVIRPKNLVVTSSKDCDIRLWTFNEPKMSLNCTGTTSGHTSTVGALATSHTDSKNDFVVSGSEDSTLKVWRLTAETTHKKTKYSLQPEHTEVAHEKGINSVSVSPDDKWIVSAGGDKTAKVWKARPFGLKGVLRGHKRPVWCALFAPHDQIVGTSSADGTVKLWALSNLTCLKTFEGHDCSVMKFAFLSRGLQIISAGSDGLLKLWDVRKNTCMKTFDEHDDKVWSLEVSSDEKHLLTGAGDSTFLLWEDVTEEELAAERQKADANIEREQELQNLLQNKDFLKAFRIALDLDQPNRLLHIIGDIMKEPSGQEKLTVVLKSLDDFNLEQLLRYIVAWNTNSRHTYYAQSTLACIFRTVLPKRLLQLPKIGSYVEGLIPYTERHAARLDQLHVSSLFSRYLWNNVKQLGDMEKT
ncbi:hypothetical protein RvY_15638 [Ramazzottius varieornatus]|uniref:U3 small nucleolar RNA-associated protein 13 C-terminal domain-containing protein n=1 Tax=Ramazzottius varieornatus TaxID=947166 RepID=A0A1D1W085_RAMVA|nr:hypothetical protein RvY_15638 [Ramazzottius varieornatus]